MDPDEALANLFFTDEGIENPAPLYRALREGAPVHHSATGAFVLTRFEDCRELLRDNRFGKANRAGGSIIPNADPEATELRRAQVQRSIDEKRSTSMLFLNPPHHTRQRSLVSRVFTPRRVEKMRENIRELSQQIIGDFVAQGGGDLLDKVAFPLPVAVIGQLVGVPEQDWPQFRSLVSQSAAALEPGATVEDLTLAEASRHEVGAYFVDLVKERRADPQDDLLSDLLAVEEAGDSLSEGEVIAVATLLFAAGFETTTNLIGNGMGALLRHPDQKEKLWADPSLLPSAVDEMLRWDSPIQFDARSALEDADISGVDVAKESTVITLLGAANYDPAQFSDPETFDISRDEGPPMSFGSGIHYCLGANLSKAEGQEVFGALIDHAVSIELAGELTRRRRMGFRGYESLPVEIVAR